MPEQHVNARWISDPREGGLTYIEAGMYDPMVRAEATLFLPDGVIPLLVEALEELGYLRPRLDERLREGDLRVIHRLIDVVTLEIQANGRRLPPPLLAVDEDDPRTLRRRA